MIKVQAQVRADGFEATPYITEKSVLKVTLEGDAEIVQNVKDAIRLLNTIPKELCNISLSFDKGELDEVKTAEAVQSLYDNCKLSCDLIKTEESSSIYPIYELLKKDSENLSTFLREHDTMNPEIMSGDFKHLQLSVLIDYILFFDQK